MIPKTSMATSRKLRITQPTFRATASKTRHAPSVMKNATDLRRRALTRMDRDYSRSKFTVRFLTRAPFATLTRRYRLYGTDPTQVTSLLNHLLLPTAPSDF